MSLPPFTNCTNNLQALICSIGGVCIRDTSSGIESCLCNSGFQHDYSWFKGRKDCSLPTNAYLGWAIFQTIITWIVVYRLLKVLKRSKGLFLLLTQSWCVAIVGVLIVVYGLAFQYEYLEAAAVGATIGSIGVANSGWIVFQLIVDARYAIILTQSNKTRMLYLRLGRYLTNFILLIIGIAQICLCRTDYANIPMFLWIGFESIMLLIVPILIMYNAQCFIISLRKLIESGVQHLNENDEKPLLIKRLQLIQMACLVLIGFMVAFFTMTVFFAVVWMAPMMWVLGIILVESINVVGLLIERINELISSFQLKKQAREDKGLIFETGREAIPLYSKDASSFVLIPVQSRNVYYDSLYHYLCGIEFAKATIKLGKSNWWIALAYIGCPICVVFSLVELITGVFNPVTLSVTIFLIYFGITYIPASGGLSISNFIDTLKNSQEYQYRVLVIIIITIPACSVLNFDIRSLLLIHLLYGCSFTFNLDNFTKEKFIYIYLILFFSMSLPYAVWFLFLFDLLEKRQNVVVNQYFSVYHFATDMLMIQVWCYFLDGTTLMKQGFNILLLKSKQIKTRLVSLQEEEDNEAVTLLQYHEMDFIAENTTTDDKMGNKQRKRKQKVYASKVLIRQKDSFACILFGNRIAKRIFDLQDNYSFFISFSSGIIIGGNLTLIFTLVLMKIVPDTISLISLLSIFPIFWRFLLKSKPILLFLIRRIEFAYDFLLVSVIFSFLGISLEPEHGFLTSILIVGELAILFFDWRTSDAFACSSCSPYRLSFFLPVFSSTLLFPILVISTAITVSHENFGIVPAVGAALDYQNLTDVFILVNPPKSTFARLRFSQIVIDIWLAFLLSVLLGFFQYVRSVRNNSVKIVLQYIKVPIKPQFQDFGPIKYESTSDEPQWTTSHQDSYIPDSPNAPVPIRGSAKVESENGTNSSKGAKIEPVLEVRLSDFQEMDHADDRENLAHVKTDKKHESSSNEHSLQQVHAAESQSESKSGNI